MGPMTPAELSAWIKEQGRAAGFDRVGIAPVTGLPELEFLPRWLERGYAGRMDYLRDPRRRDARALLPGARSVICAALNYNTAPPFSTEVPRDPERGWLARYAWGDDYHSVVGEKLARLRDALAEEIGDGFEGKACVDTGPVVERDYARRAGLGWLAKNTTLLNADGGSWFFLGVLVTNLELEPDSPLPDGCGACTLCLEACPTGALVEPYVMDARRCISYLTIELREAIPEEFRAPLGRHVFGCDICQDVCPYNRQAWLSDAAAFQPRVVETRNAKLETRHDRDDRPRALFASHPPGPAAPAAGSPGESFFHPRLDWLANLTEDDYRRFFKNSAVKRTKWRGLLRNTLVAMGNSAHQRFRPLLERFAAGADSLLAEHARWALARLRALS